MLTRIRRAAGEQPGDAGVSLAETLVAMAITTLVAGIALSFFVWTGRTTSNAAENSFTTDGARLAVSTMAATLRLADTPTSQPGSTLFRVVAPLSRTSISFFANDNGNRAGSAVRSLPTRIVYAFSGGAVTETRYRPLAGAVASSAAWSANYPTTPTSTRTLLRGVSGLRLDYDAIADATTGVVTRASDADLAKAAADQPVPVAVTVTLVTAATTGRPAQSLTATAVLTGSTS